MTWRYIYILNFGGRPLIKVPCLKQLLYFIDVKTYSRRKNRNMHIKIYPDNYDSEKGENP